MSAPAVHLVVPGSLDQRTGGYLYDARMVREMRGRGREVVVHELEGLFPEGDDAARSSLRRSLGALDDGTAVIVDGLAGGGLPEVLRTEAERLRLVGLVHHPLSDETGLDQEAVARFRASERAALAVCRGVVVTSPFTADRLSTFDIPPERVKVAVPGTEPAERAIGPDAGEPPRLLCVASLTPRKGHDVLVDALAAISDVPWSCAIAGSDAYDPAHAAAVRERVQLRDLDRRVSFIGELEESRLDAEYKRSTIFVLASHYEGYGMALTEAIARGVPVISTTGGAIPFTVPAEAGVLVPPGNAVRLAEALRTVLTDSGLLAELRVGAARAARDLPDWSRASRRFEAAVDELSGLPVSAGPPS